MKGTIDSFDKAWLKLSEIGACDSIGGMEYERVRAEWDAAKGVPGLDVETFIRRRANVFPGGES